MKNAFILILSSSLSGSFIFGFVLLLKRKVMTYSAKWYYFLMKYTLMFFMLPTALMVFSFFHFLTISTKIITNQPDFGFYYISSGFHTISSRPYLYSSILDYLFIGWLICAIAIILHTSLSGIRYCHDLKLISKICTDDMLLETKNKLQEKLDIKRDVQLYHCATLSSPVFMGIFRPVIIFPETDYSDTEISLMLTHELIHYKSHDILFRKIITFLKAFHWFNPVIYHFGHLFYECSEMACDDKVLENETQSSRVQYANLIVKMIEVSFTNKNAFMAALVNDDSDKIKRRLENIMKNKLVKVKPIIAVIAFALMLTVYPTTIFASTYGVVAAQDKLLGLVEENTEIEEAPFVLAETVETFDMDLINTNSRIISMRGTNSINETIASGKSITITVKVTSGTVGVGLASGSSSDKYKVSVINSSGSAVSVSTTNGRISHDFSVANGTYTISIQNTSSTAITISGNIYI